MESDACTLETLIEAETGERPSAVNEVRVTEPTRDLFGIALSGGGIRSSTFNLGLLQGLHRFELLDDLDYLSTVSGGGYVGGFWSAWRSRSRPSPTSGVFPDGTGSDGIPEPDSVRHLREFGNFLAPRLSMLSWDTGRMLVNLISSMVPSLLTALSVIALSILTWCLTAFGLFALDRTTSTAFFVGMSLLLLIVTEAVWSRRREETDWFAYSEALLWIILVSGFAWWMMHMIVRPDGTGWYGAGRRLPLLGEDESATEQLYILMPVAVWMIGSLTLSIRRWWGSPWVRNHEQRVRRNSFDRVHARFLLAAVAWIALAGLWWIGAGLGVLAAGRFQPQVTTGLVGSTGVMVWIFSRIQKRISSESRGGLGAGWLSRLKPVLPQAAAYVAVLLMIVTTVAAIVLFNGSDVTFSAPIAAGVIACIILVLAALLLNPNEIGLHTFYRARISRAYLGASNPHPYARGKTEERKDDDLQLDELSSARPFHLICCAANDLATHDIGTLGRGAASAVLSRAGLTVAQKCRLWNDVHPAPSLSAALTASAAAFNPLMGGMSKKLGPAVTFLMAAFNLRLGLWLPGVARRKPLNLFERALPGLPFLKEMFGLARAEGRHVHLSDGGHFENMALYELIRRHCRLIIASDCGMDPDVSFSDFGNLVRRVRADFGVDVRIDLSPLRPAADGRSRQTMVAGDIHYPEGDTGILLLFKPGITGNEPADVAQYRARNAVFPHESTTDQFYDEAQWEAYRRLGEHVAHEAFRHVTSGLAGRRHGYVGEVFLRARREGQAVPEGFGDRLAHFTDRITEIDTLLRQPECARLLREVYAEIDELERDGTTDERPKDDVENPSRQRHADADVTSSDGDARTRLPHPSDLAPSLHVIRHALLLLQEVYTTENLEENYQHPLYLGVINYFARWTSAPLFRLWWPLLKTLYPQPFTRFVEQQYGIHPGGTADEPVNGWIGPPVREVRGFAMRAWSHFRTEALDEGQSILPFMMNLQYEAHRYQLQAAHVVVARVGPHLVWDAKDFFVPPGLWGIGVGSSFLRQMRAGIPTMPTPTPRPAASHEPPPAASHEPPPVRDKGSRPGAGLFVRIRIDPRGGTSAKKWAANEIHLYRSAGFQLIKAVDVPLEVAKTLSRLDHARSPRTEPLSTRDGATRTSDHTEEWMASI